MLAEERPDSSRKDAKDAKPASTSMDHKVYKGTSGQQGNGPFFTLVFTVQGNVATSIDFDCNGCFAPVEVGEAIVRFCTGREVERIRSLEVSDLLVLNPLPESHGYYATMAVEAIADAFKDWKTEGLEE